MIRTCRECLTDKELDEFPKDKYSKDGHRHQCNECRKAYHRKNSKLWYEKNRKVKIAKVMERERRLRKSGKWIKKPFRSSEEFLERERLRSKKRRQDPSYKRHHANYVRMYQVRKHQAPGKATRVQLQARWEYYGGKCYICTEDATEFDHVIPITKGGTNWPANLKPICRSCNAKKSNIWPYIQLTQGAI